MHVRIHVCDFSFGQLGEHVWHLWAMYTFFQLMNWSKHEGTQRAKQRLWLVELGCHGFHHSPGVCFGHDSANPSAVMNAKLTFLRLLAHSLLGSIYIYITTRNFGPKREACHLRKMWRRVLGPTVSSASQNTISQGPVY